MSLATLAFGQDHTTAPSKGGKASPHQQFTAKAGNATITIVYGRPSKKGRKIFGGLEPYDKVWRTGADEATTFTTDRDLTVGTLKVPAGTYSLFTIPGQKEWTLVFNKVANQWGAFKYDPSQDLGRTSMKVEKLATPTEQLTISLSGSVLRIAWDDTAASVPIKAN
jgi:hypothetical protein